MSAVDERPRTLFVHHRSGIGDLVWHLPYIRAIAAGSARGRVSVLARPSCRAADLLAAELCVDEVIEFDRRPRASEGRTGAHDALAAQWQLARVLRAHRFERVFIFSGRVRYAALTLLAGIPQRAGFGFSRAERLLLNRPPFIEPHRGAGNWVYPEASAFAIAHGVVTAPVVPRMAVLASARDEAVHTLQSLPPARCAFSIGTSEPRKQWGAERFATLATALVERSRSVVLLGGPAEAALAARIVAGVPQPLRARVLPLTQPSVQRTAATLAQCAACVGNDTGVLNLAVAVGTPALGLFGATPPLAHDPLLQAMVGDGMAAIVPQAVLARVERMLAEGAPAA